MSSGKVSVVHTAVWKKSVPGRVMARRLNLDGAVKETRGAGGGTAP